MSGGVERLRTSPSLANPSSVPIVAIGASAGGVKALQVLFGALPEGLGAAYVVIVHLFPGHQSDLPAILQACTRMPVAQVVTPTPLRRNSIYVIPPDRKLVLIGETINAVEFDEPRGRRTPIDQFLLSLAEQHCDGIAIVLTGAGSDGALGVKAVKEAGGVVVVQDPTEADYASMPRSSIATGAADFVLPISEIAGTLKSLIPIALRPGVPAVQEVDTEILRGIYEHVRKRTGHDFTKYKHSTLLRRLARRMQVNRVEKLDDYLCLLHETPEEVEALFRDFIISVTSFFRDPAAFLVLEKQVVPKLFENRGRQDCIRVWVPGCATGEEAYSIAMLLLDEAAKHDGWPELQVFASDIDTTALATARECCYSASSVAEISDERRSRYFVEEGEHYRLKREVRDIVLFASHNIVKDPPFSNIDLVSCRNLLIYFGSELQRYACAMFHYALRPGGFLFLGTSEAAEFLEGRFRLFDRDARIYVAIDSPQERKVLPKLTYVPRQAGGLSHRVAHARFLNEASLHQQALEEAAPPSILVDESKRVIDLSETAGRFVYMPGGPFRATLTEIVRPELRFTLHALLSRVDREGKPVLSLPVTVAIDGTSRKVVMQARPVRGDEGEREKRTLIFFLDGGETEALRGVPQEEGVGAQEIIDLRRELEVTRAGLKSTRDDFEITTEELRATNEELESINEEYRSTSEELETSKEELESINEELQTVNNELKLKLESVARAHSDLQNLISATDVGTLFLDSQSRIKRFTPRIADVFNITDTDEGRPITNFTHRLAYAGLIDDIQKVLSDLAPIEHEVESESGRWYLVRLRPYRTEQDKIDGVVITFVDTTQRRRAENALRDSETRLHLASEAAELGIYEFDPAGDALWLDKRSRQLLGLPAEQELGLSDLWQRMHPDDVGGVRDAIRIAAESPGNEPFLLDCRLAMAPVRWVRLQGRMFEAAIAGGRQLPRLIGTIQETTERKAAEIRQRLLLGELSHRVKNTLAIVQSIARQTLRGPGTRAEVLSCFDGRLRALASSHDILVESNWEGADFATLAERQLVALVDNMCRVELTGPAVKMPPAMATSVGLLLHELATNATKYGALSSPAGRVQLTWQLVLRDTRPILELHWKEDGGPPVTPPDVRGFGTFLIERGIPGAEVKRTFATEGVECFVSLPLNQAERAPPALQPPDQVPLRGATPPGEANAL
ncbi:MAG: CheR family methyltransferase [Hyphomicrobium sp.]